MLEGSDAKTETVQGLLLPSPTSPTRSCIGGGTWSDERTAINRPERDREGNRPGRSSDKERRYAIEAPFHGVRRAIMSARSPDWRSGANPSGVALDAFPDVPFFLFTLHPSRAVSLCSIRFFSLGDVPTARPVLHHAFDVLPSTSLLSSSA